MKNTIYVDNAATTKTSKNVVDSMIPYFEKIYGNPSSPHSMGIKAKEALENSRLKVAKCLNALPSEIFFTSGGSESDNWAIKGIAHELLKKGKNHIITSKFEHHAVLHTLDSLKKEGFEVTYLDVHENGIVKPNELENAITDKTLLVSIMFANNEIGTVQPIKEIGAICKKHKILFHTDAVQAIGHIKIDVKDMNIDLLSLSAHKFHGPKGIGALYVRKGIRLQNFVDGGAQEFGHRAGTENLPAIVGLSFAIEEAYQNIDQKNKHLIEMRNKLIKEVLKIEHSRLNGDINFRLPGNANFCFEGIEGESLLLMLNAKGIYASSGSACTSGSLDPSHVLLSIGLPHEIAHGSLRISLCEENTMEEVDYIIEVLPKIVDKLRSMSPLWDKIIEKDKNNI